jgi:hypothetical protein
MTTDTLKISLLCIFPLHYVLQLSLVETIDNNWETIRTIAGVKKCLLWKIIQEISHTPLDRQHLFSSLSLQTTVV